MKTYLFDTSVIIPALIQSHPHHFQSFKWLEALKKGKLAGALSQHGLSEVYAVLTKLPLKPSLSPTFCLDFIRNTLMKDFQVIDLSKSDYVKALTRVQAKSLRGGVVYDALHVEAALKKNLAGVVTFNERHFQALVSKDELPILNPLNEMP